MSGTSWLAAVGLPAVPLVPLLLALGLIPRSSRALAIRCTPAAALPALAVAVSVCDAQLDLPWVLLGARLGIGPTAGAFLFFTAVLWFLAGAYARAYLRTDPTRSRFFAFYLAAMSGNLGLIVSGDVASFFVFFALMSFASYGLVIHARDAQARYAARIYIYLVIVGEVLLFSGLAMAAHSAGSIYLTDVARAPLSQLTVGLLLAGFGIKAGALPLHVWLPLAHPVAPTPASAVLSGAMIKAGLLGWMRFLPLGEASYGGWGQTCAAAGLAAAFFGVVAGVVQRNPKTVLAYSSISQMGFMTIGVGVALAAPQAAAPVLAALTLYAVHHGLAKGALFLAVGVAASATETGIRRGLLAFGLVLPALALAGAPLTSGALAKTALKSAIDDVPAYAGIWFMALLSLAAAGTTLLMARFLYLAWPRAPRERPQAGLWWPWLGCVMLVALALWVWPGTAEVARQTLAPATIGAAVWPIGLGVLLALVAWRVLVGRRLPPAVHVPPGDLVVLAEAWARAAAQAWGLIAAASAQAAGACSRRASNAIAGLSTGLADVSRYELRLRPWHAAGAALLALVVTVLVMLAAG